MLSDSQRLAFGQEADLYDRVRPRYPIEALRWMLGEHPLRVVDLGAGTGILTRQLVDLGHEVVPVEPDAGMRRRLAEVGNAREALDGSAENIPLPDGDVDAVVAGQAYHWFDREKAHPEIARVLRPQGIFAPVWNVRDETEPWIARLTELLDEVAARGTGLDERRLDSFGDLFTEPEQGRFPFSRTMTADGLVELVRSRSYYLTSPPERKARLEAQVRELVADQPAEFPLPYVTYAYRAVKR